MNPAEPEQEEDDRYLPTEGYSDKEINELINSQAKDIAKLKAEYDKLFKHNEDLKKSYEQQLSERQDKLNHLIADEVSYRHEIEKLKAELATTEKQGISYMETDKKAILNLQQQIACTKKPHHKLAFLLGFALGLIYLIVCLLKYIEN